MGATSLAVAGLVGLDRRIALWSADTQPGEALISGAIGWLDLLVLKEISTFLLGALLLIAAGIALSNRRARRPGWLILYLALVHFLATAIADLSKPLFGRLRPYEAMADGGLQDIWFVSANAFPSGHTAFYAGLCFPLALLLPRWSLLWLLPPLFIAFARVVEHDHYLSDVSASLALAALLSIGFEFIRRKGTGAEPMVAAD